MPHLISKPFVTISNHPKKRARSLPYLAAVLGLLASVAGCLVPVDPESSAEPTGEAVDPLSLGAGAVYTITSQSAPATAASCNDPNSSAWCKCGTDYTDNAARCNTASEVLLAHFPAPGCTVKDATLSYQASLWAGDSAVTVRRILRPVTRPTMGVAGLCATTSMASWYRSGAEAWTAPGASGDGSDRTAEGAGRTLASGGNRTESFDVTALVNGCPMSGECVLAQYASGAHINVLGGTVALTYTCAGPAAVCGDGVLQGSETCDDGNTMAGDGCSEACATEMCKCP